MILHSIAAMIEEPAKPVEQNPAIYLRQVPEPGGREQLLAEQVGLHHGAFVPFWMVASVALRVHPIADWSSRFDAAWRRLRRYVIGGAIFAATHLSIVGVWWLQAHDSRVASEERSAAAERSFQEYRRVTDDKIEQLRLDVRELRRELRKISGADPQPGISIVRSLLGHPPEDSNACTADPDPGLCLLDATGAGAGDTDVVRRRMLDEHRVPGHRALQLLLPGHVQFEPAGRADDGRRCRRLSIHHEVKGPLQCSPLGPVTLSPPSL